MQSDVATDAPERNRGNTVISNVSIRLNEKGTEFSKRYVGLVKVTHSTPNVDFYQVDWDARPRGIVAVEHGSHSLVIEDVLGVQAAQHLTGVIADEGMYEFDISAGMSVPSPSLIAHDEARLKTYAILQRILEAGWVPITSRSRPRLHGQARLNYAINVSNSVGLDPRYVPTLEEWMKLERGTEWRFYADHIYLNIGFERERTLLDPLKPGSYLLNFNVKSETEHFRAYVESEDRAKWQTLLPATLSKLAAMRLKTETELRTKGIPVDDSYQDPPIPALK